MMTTNTLTAWKTRKASDTIRVYERIALKLLCIGCRVNEFEAGMSLLTSGINVPNCFDDK